MSTIDEAIAELADSVDAVTDTFRSLKHLSSIPIFEDSDLIFSVVRRTCSLTDGFCSLIREKNHYAASALIRPNLENLLMIQAGESHPMGPNGLARDLMTVKQNGKLTELRDIKDKFGKAMTGRRLAKQFDELGVYGLIEDGMNILPDNTLIRVRDPVSACLEDLWAFYSGHVHFDPKWLLEGLTDVWIEGNTGTVEFRWDMESYTIAQATDEDVLEWISIMKFVVKNVHLVLTEYVRAAETWLPFDCSVQVSD